MWRTARLAAIVAEGHAGAVPARRSLPPLRFGWSDRDRGGVEAVQQAGVMGSRVFSE